MKNKLIRTTLNLSYITKDKDFKSTLLNHGSKLVTGPLLLIMIPLFISKEIQGYWFSFMSVSALSLLADLGFTIIILQFSAHEFAYLRFKNNLIVPIQEDNKEHLYKLALLFKFSVKWVKRLIFFTFPIIFLVGIYLFKDKNKDIVWLMPWVIYTISAAIAFINNVILSFFEGCNSVSDIQKLRFTNTVINFIILFTLLFFKFNLYALSIALLLSSLFTSLSIYNKYGKLIIYFYRICIYHSYDWFKEFWQYFRGYSISVVTGFLLVQIYTPIAFRNFGPASAGRVGLTMSLTTAIFSISNIWFQSIAPKVNILASKKSWLELEKLIINRLKFAMSTFLFLIIIFFAFLFLIKQTRFSEIENRFLSLQGLIILFSYFFIQIIITAMAFFLRSTKKEPYMKLSILGSLMVLILTYFSSKWFTVDYIFLGLLITTIITFPVSYNIYIKRKLDWCS